ncbi:MAG: hypothetical protein ACRENA_11605, partial [Vulcanimicrobiaceae bacterium]
MIAPSRVAEIKARRLSLPLVRPYHLSLGAVEAFETIVVEVGDGERVGYGEATYLNGYTDETIESGWQSVKEIVSLLAGASISPGRERLAAMLAQAPFTVSAFGTALDMLEGNAR